MKNAGRGNMTVHNSWPYALASVLFTSLLAWHFCWYQFGGYDLSPIIDMTYRMAHGQSPGVDFINTLPLSFAAWLKLNTSLFGLTWGTLTLAGIDLFVLTAVTAFTLWPMIGSGRFRVHMVTVLCLPILVTNHIWHSYMSEYLGLLYFLGLLITVTRKEHWVIGGAVLILSAGPLFFAKQNNGLPFIALSTVYVCSLMLLRREWRLLLVLVLIGISILLTALLHVTFLGQSLKTIIYTFTAVSGRALPQSGLFRQTVLVWYFFFIIVAVIALLIALRGNFSLLRRRDPFAILCYIAWAIGALGFFTNWDIKYNDLPMLLVPPLALLSNAEIPTCEDASGAFMQFSSTLTSVTVFLFLSAILLGDLRMRMKAVGPFFENEPLTAITNEGYLQGLKVGPQMLAIISDFKSFLTAYPDAVAGGLYCGPRIEFCYASFSLPVHLMQCETSRPWLANSKIFDFGIWFSGAQIGHACQSPY